MKVQAQHRERAAYAFTGPGFCVAIGLIHVSAVIAGNGVGADVAVSNITGAMTYGTANACSATNTACMDAAECDANICRRSGRACAIDTQCRGCSRSGATCAVDQDCPPGESCLLADTCGETCDVEVAGFSFGTGACNVGTVNLNWCNTDFSPQFCLKHEHPAILQNLYRLKNNRFEQIAMAWVKHGFFALDTNEASCSALTGGAPCQDAGTGSELGLGCWDVYFPMLNGAQSNLGPRSEINGNTGEFPFPYILQSGETDDDPGFKRIRTKVSDIDPATNASSRYFFEAHYVTADDAMDRNGNNNATYREVTFTGPNQNNNYIPEFPGVMDSVAGDPAIYAWQSIDPTVNISQAQLAGEGLFIVGAKATDLGTGFWHYEYAVMNLNSDRSAGSFSVSLPLGAIVENVGFHDVSYHSGEPYDGTDWSVGISNKIEWSTQDHSTNIDANALRFSTLYNYRFDVNSEPDPTGLVTIGLFKPGVPPEVTATTLAPFLSVVDCNNNGIPDGMDIAPFGEIPDCDSNGVPDDCQTNCNGNDTADVCEIDQNSPAPGGPFFCTSGCEPDCNVNGVPDVCDADCDSNGRPDACDIDMNSPAPDGPYYCDANCDPDCNVNGVPDDCDPDCNENGIPDGCHMDPQNPDTDIDGVLDCEDACRLTTPEQACDCDDIVCCVTGLNQCPGGALMTTPQFCCDINGTPDCPLWSTCAPWEFCRDGCLTGDADGDGKRTLFDWAGMQNCFGIGGVDPNFAECTGIYDYDLNDEVDWVDYQKWHAGAFGGGP